MQINISVHASLAVYYILLFKLRYMHKNNVSIRAVAIEYFSNRVFYWKLHWLIKQSDKN